MNPVAYAVWMGLETNSVVQRINPLPAICCIQPRESEHTGHGQDIGRDTAWTEEDIDNGNDFSDVSWRVRAR